MSDFYSSMYNPDVLTCLANLSNDEVFTPPEVANRMLDMLPEELWHDSSATFLDPACKSGVFLREIAKRLIEGLKEEIPDLQKRIDHIFHKQLYGIAITELTSLLSRRSVYCSKYPNSKYSITLFEDTSGNIRYKRIPHRWQNGKCLFCGASESEYERGDELETHAYEWVHTTKPEEIFKMKFDVIIGNPPYQLSDGGGSNGISAKPIYNLFVEQAIKLSPRYLTMIIPARWFAGGKGLDTFRKSMANDKHITHMVHYPKSRDCFQGVDIAGGVCYFLRERDRESDCIFTSRIANIENVRIRELNEFPILIADNIGVDIVHKVQSKCATFISDRVLTRNSFGFTTSSRGQSKPFSNCITLISSAGISYVDSSKVLKNQDKVPQYKISIGTLNPDRAGVNNASDGKMNVTTKVRILNPNEVVTETYIIIDTFDDEQRATNFAKYICTLFVRFLISLTISSMHIVKGNFQFVPNMGYDREWTDQDLYKYFGLTNDEILYIESKIRPMELGGDTSGN